MKVIGFQRNTLKIHFHSDFVQWYYRSPYVGYVRVWRTIACVAQRVATLLKSQLCARDTLQRLNIDLIVIKKEFEFHLSRIILMSKIPVRESESSLSLW